VKLKGMGDVFYPLILFKPAIQMYVFYVLTLG